MTARFRRLNIWSLLSAVIISAGLGIGYSQPQWEMRVCADPSRLPYSGQEQPGYDNIIAEILADELGAELVITWIPLEQLNVMAEHYLHTGACDLIFGLQDSEEAFLKSSSYYRSPYVFVFRSDSPYSIGSFGDAALADLRIGVLGAPAEAALRQYGHSENVTTWDVQSPYGEPGRLGNVVRAVAEGELDVAVTWGPIAGYFADQHGADLTVVPVPSEIEPPFIYLYKPMTIGMRPGDEAYRDRLGIALANRWDEVQEVLATYGVPLLPLPKPVESVTAAREGAVMPRIGVILPLQNSGQRHLLSDVLSNSARMGAVMASDHVRASQSEILIDPRLLIANAPTPEAAENAARRLIATEGIFAIVGGIGDGHAEVLHEVANENGVLFFNIGSSEAGIREASDGSLTFHVESSMAQYLEALVAPEAGQTAVNWAVIHDDSEDGAELSAMLTATLSDVGDEAPVSYLPVESDQYVFINEVRAIEDLAPVSVVLLVDTERQEMFSNQLENFADPSGVRVLAFPELPGQTRNFLVSLRTAAPGVAVQPRVALWDTSLDSGTAGTLNDQFMSRWGEPMEPSAWAAYQAISMISAAVRHNTATDAVQAAEYFLDPEVDFDIAKEMPGFFCASTHQLIQPLYSIQVDSDAPWDARVSSRAGIAKVLAVHQPDADTACDQETP